MGKKDIGLKVYLQNTARYADLWNGAVFQGKQIVKTEDLQEVTPVHSKSDQETVLERTADMVMKQSYSGQKFVILALENQEKIDYGMPIRVMLQEALEYDRQLREIKRENRRKYKEICEKNNGESQETFYRDNGEYLYSVRKQDHICPVMTLVVYWGEEEWQGAKSIHEMIDFGGMDSFMEKELKRMIPEYPLHFLNLSDFKHFDYFKTELRPLFEMFQRRNSKEDFMQYIRTNERCWNMDEESWYMLGQLTDSKDIKSLICRKNQRERSGRGMCKALEDLKAEGKAEYVIALLEEYGELSVEMKRKILGQTDLRILDEWFRTAIHTKSIDEFIHQSHLN